MLRAFHEWDKGWHFSTLPLLQSRIHALEFSIMPYSEPALRKGLRHEQIPLVRDKELTDTPTEKGALFVPGVMLTGGRAALTHKISISMF